VSRDQRVGRMKKYYPWLASLLIRAIAATLRVTTDDRGGILNKPDHAPVIIAFWHNRTFLMAPYYEKYCGRGGRTSYTFISRSRDGQFMADVAQKFGVLAVRGSSSRHGMSAALAALRKSDDERVDLTITPDGPRGPRYEVQPGVMRLAQSTGRPIVAIDCQIAWRIELKSWDRFRIPLPFSRVYLSTAPPIHVPAEASDEEMAALEQQLKEALGGD
jgi:lysophospholipid acyltransferase (LPLAT)-like uncharacterized protein